MRPLPRTQRGHEYILIFQDLFTRWIEVIPIKRADGKSVIKGLNERFCVRFGVPEVVLSDNGTEFKNAILDTFSKERAVHHTYMPPYHPQANPLERVNRTVKTMIMSYAEENHRSWVENLSELTFAYNTAEHSSTKRSPAMLSFGRQPDPPKTIRREADSRRPKTAGSSGKLGSAHGQA